MFEQWGAVLAFDAPGAATYSLFAPRPDLDDRLEHYFTMTYALTHVDGLTRVTISQHDPRFPVVASAAVDREGDGEGSSENPILAGLRASPSAELTLQPHSLG